MNIKNIGILAALMFLTACGDSKIPFEVMSINHIRTMDRGPSECSVRFRGGGEMWVGSMREICASLKIGDVISCSPIGYCPRMWRKLVKVSHSEEY